MFQYEISSGVTNDLESWNSQMSSTLGMPLYGSIGKIRDASSIFGEKLIYSLFFLAGNQ